MTEHLLALLDDLVTRDPDAPIAIDAAGPHGVSRAELRLRALRLAGDLVRAGVGRVDCVGVW